MSNLANKNILIGITGSIAAYKVADLTRRLRACHANVKIVMTEGATQFITELTLQALSSQPVYKNLLDPQSEASMSHISLAKWADLLLVAPATAHVMAKFSSGFADDLLSTLYLATTAPTIMVPAMNQQMWQHPATVENKLKLEQQGVIFLGPDFGSQACGDVGPGRMFEPEAIILQLENFFSPKILTKIKCLITAGPTREPIDPVRYISNYSSGKMGYALAEQAAKLGANVLLISGPTCLQSPFGVETITVETANEMYEAVMKEVSNCEIFISCAAVADFKCSNIAKQKIKKSSLSMIKLEQNVDILWQVSQLPKPPFLVGFAAESDNLLSHAKEKLALKNLDVIIANEVGMREFGFNSDYNKVSVVTKTKQVDFALASKKKLAQKILEFIYQTYLKN